MNHYVVFNTILCLLLSTLIMQEQYELVIDIEETGETGITEVYCSFRGCPTLVLNATHWSYDNDTNIATVTHNRSVTVIWIEDADVSPEATIDASQNILIGFLLIFVVIILYVKLKNGFVFQRLR